MSNTKHTPAQKRGNPVNPAFNFWIGNRLDAKRSFFVSDMRQLFQKWLLERDKEWLQYYGCQTVIIEFITGKEKHAIGGTFDQKELPEIVRLLTPDYKKATE